MRRLSLAVIANRPASKFQCSAASFPSRNDLTPCNTTASGLFYAFSSPTHQSNLMENDE